MRTNPTGGVGYRNPPKHSQFKKGTSGNPSGRPKGSLNMSETLYTNLMSRIRISINGRRRYVPMMEAISLQVLHQAMKGNVAASRVFLQLIQLAQNWEAANEERGPRVTLVLSGDDAKL